MFLILDTYHPDTPYLHETGCEEPSFFEAKRARERKSSENTVTEPSSVSISHYVLFAMLRCHALSAALYCFA